PLSTVCSSTASSTSAAFFAAATSAAASTAATFFGATTVATATFHATATPAARGFSRAPTPASEGPTAATARRRLMATDLVCASFSGTPTCLTGAATRYLTSTAACCLASAAGTARFSSATCRSEEHTSELQSHL